jgi:Conjugal transfer protein
MRVGMWIGAVLLAGCVHEEVYPPALPAPRAGIQSSGDIYDPMDSDTPARSAPATVLGPSEQEWAALRAYVPPQKVCTGRGKRRHCMLVTPTAVEQANVTALVKPTTVHTREGQSVQVHYPLRRDGFHVYQIVTSPGEFTNLLLPRGERPVAELTLAPHDWDVRYGTPTESTEMQLIKVQPREAGLKGRDMLLTRTGIPIYLEFVATERRGMLSVTWDVPPVARQPAVPSLDQRPPKFAQALAYSGYTMTVASRSKVRPPWMPLAVLDDGTNTVVQFGTSLDGQRLPAIVGLDQMGKPTIVASRLYVPPDARQGHPWLYVQGLHPALQLKDGAGLAVTIVREVPDAR